MFGRKAAEIVAYSYPDTYCPEHLIEEMITRGVASPGARGMVVEDVLDQIAGADGIDRQDERTFDSNEFPKVVFSSDLEDGETCAHGDHEID